MARQLKTPPDDDDAHDSTNKNETVYIAINSDQIKRLSVNKTLN